MYNLIGIFFFLAGAFLFIAICSANMKVYKTNSSIFDTAGSIATILFIAAWILILMYSSEDPANWSVATKLKYIESGKEIPTERNPKYDKQFNEGWIIGLGSATVLLSAFGIYTFYLTCTKKYKRYKYKDKLWERRRALEWQFRYCKINSKEYDLFKEAIAAIDKILKNLEWQEKLEKVKGGLDLINEIQQDSSWKDLQTEIDKLEAYIELNGDEYEYSND